MTHDEAKQMFTALVQPILNAHADALEEIDLLKAALGDADRETERAEAALAESKELTPDAERYRWLREPQDHICVEVEEENEDGWTGTFYALVRDDLDAAIDAARGSKP